MPILVLPKFILVVDDDVNVRDWKEAILALTISMDADVQQRMDGILETLGL